jgi:hypothetical protein
MIPNWLGWSIVAATLIAGISTTIYLAYWLLPGKTEAWAKKAYAQGYRVKDGKIVQTK